MIDLTKLKRITKVRLPFDMRHTDPKQNYGIHGLDVWFILSGDKNAVQFQVNFPVFLPHVDLEKSTWKFQPEITGCDVGYHAHLPQYEGQTEMKCDLFECGKCFYDGSSLRAQEWADEIFSIRGSRPEDRVWIKLEQEYIERFVEKELDP